MVAPIATALSLSNRPFLIATLSCLSSRAKPRDLQFSGPFVEMFIGWSELCKIASSKYIRTQHKPEPHIPAKPLHVIRPPGIVVQTKMHSLREIRLLPGEIDR